MDPPQSLPPMTFQFRPVGVPPQQPQQFVPAPAPSHPFQPVGIGRGVPPPMNVAVLPPGPPQAPRPFYPQPMQQFPPRGSGQSIPLPVPHPHPSVQTPNGFTPSIAGPAMPISSSYTFAPSFGQAQSGFRDNATQFPALPQVPTVNIASNGLSILSSENQIGVSTTPQPTPKQPSITNVISLAAANIQPNLAAEALPDWREHTSADGRKYYFNRRTRLSSWEKPIELMSPIERADASTNWKEFISPDGKKYYYNKATKESKWVIPEELKLAREQAMKAPLNETPESMLVTTSSTAPDTGSSPIAESEAVPAVDTPSKAEGSMLDESSKPEDLTSSPSPDSVKVIGGGKEQLQAQLVSRSSSSPVVASATETNGDGDHNRSASAVPTSDTSASVEPKNDSASVAHDVTTTSDKEESSNNVVGEKTEDVAQAPDDKLVDREPLVYVNKLEAKNAFMALLESTNVGSDWNWDRAMRVIINDKRYGALKTLGERKQAFNEYLVQRKKQDAEERRARQKRAREDFKKMLEESTEVISSVRWSKVESFFESDERFKAVERDRDRRDIFETHIEELKKEEQAKAQEEHRHNRMEYRKYLESCDFIKANSQWRRVQDRLEADERCSRLEKIVRLEIFQEYINDLEREEEEQRKIHKEELRKIERKNRDDFRKMMDEHIAEGTLTAKTLWRDYCIMVKDLPGYLVVVSNASGSTPKDLYDDVVEELQKQYDDDMERVKDAIKLGKITITSDWTFSDFNNSIMNDTGSSQVSDINLKLIFDELLERIKEREEKETKRLKRLKDDFSHLLSSIKEISASTDWEDCKIILRHRHEYRLIGDESLCQEIFENHVAQIKEQAKEREQKRKDDKARKEKERDEVERNKARHRKEKELGRRSREKDEHFEKNGADYETVADESHVGKDGKRSGKDGSRRHRKRNRSSDNLADENDHYKKSHESSSGHKKSRSASATESDHESRHRRHRRDHRHGSSRRIDDHMELEDGELGATLEDR